MEGEVFPIWSRVRVAIDSPFKGRKGTIITIHMIATPGAPTFCFYLVAFDGGHLRKLLWFAYQKVARVAPSDEQDAEC